MELYEIQIFNIEQALIMTIATILFFFVYLKRRDLLYWLFAYISLSFSLIFKIIGNIVPELNYTGIIAEQVERVTKLDTPIIKVPKVGEFHHPDEILKVIREVAK